MAKNDPEGTYEVGFGRPPTRTRFRPGTSGNPAGRPKGKRNLATVLEKSLQEKVVINENGTRKVITKLEAAVKQLVNKAAGGDLNALRHLIALAKSAEPSSESPKEQVDGFDQKVMSNVLRRWEQHRTEESANEDKSE
jgi:Family of unknown function (DUF5681)